MDSPSLERFKPTWMCSCVTCWRWPCLGRGLRLDDLQGCLPTLIIPWFCDLIFQFSYLSNGQEHPNTCTSPCDWANCWLDPNLGRAQSCLCWLAVFWVIQLSSGHWVKVSGPSQKQQAGFYAAVQVQSIICTGVTCSSQDTGCILTHLFWQHFCGYKNCLELSRACSTGFKTWLWAVETWTA